MASSWFGWTPHDPYYRNARRDPADVVTDTLMLELGWRLKEAERQHRERENEYRRLKTGVDYSWLVSTPRPAYTVSTGERLGLEELCSRIPPSYCGLVILRFREITEANDPEAQEVSGLFRSVLLETLGRLREEEEAQRLSRQWNNRRAMSMTLMTFRSRVKINPFGSQAGLAADTAESGPASELKTVSEDVERGAGERAWSVPDFRYKGLDDSKVV